MFLTIVIINVLICLLSFILFLEEKKTGRFIQMTHQLLMLDVLSDHSKCSHLIGRQKLVS